MARFQIWQRNTLVFQILINGSRYSESTAPTLGSFLVLCDLCGIWKYRCNVTADTPNMPVLGLWVSKPFIRINNLKFHIQIFCYLHWFDKSTRKVYYFPLLQFLTTLMTNKHFHSSPTTSSLTHFASTGHNSAGKMDQTNQSSKQNYWHNGFGAYF